MVILKTARAKNSINKKCMKDKILNSVKSVYPESKRGFYFEMALFLILGFLAGVAVKTEAVEKVTIGFNDYKVIPLTQDYSFSEIQKNLLEKQKTAEENKKPATENNKSRDN